MPCRLGRLTNKSKYTAWWWRVKYPCVCVYPAAPLWMIYSRYPFTHTHTACMRANFDNVLLMMSHLGSVKICCFMFPPCQQLFFISGYCVFLWEVPGLCNDIIYKKWTLRLLLIESWSEPSHKAPSTVNRFYWAVMFLGIWRWLQSSYSHSSFSLIPLVAPHTSAGFKQKQRGL